MTAETDMTIETGTLCVRQPNGRYRVAEPEEVCEYASEILFDQQLKGRRFDTIQGTEQAARYIKAKLALREHEVFACIFLDNRHRIIEYQELFRGTINGASVHPREVVKAVLAVNAAAVILVHNHPSGVAEPSQADLSITNRLKSALDLVDAKVLDHLIVGVESITSFAERGLI